MGVVAMTKGVTGALNARQRISPFYTGGGVNTGGVAALARPGETPFLHVMVCEKGEKEGRRRRTHTEGMCGKGEGA